MDKCKHYLDHQTKYISFVDEKNLLNVTTFALLFNSVLFPQLNFSINDGNHESFLSKIKPFIRMTVQERSVSPADRRHGRIKGALGDCFQTGLRPSQDMLHPSESINPVAAQIRLELLKVEVYSQKVRRAII